MTIQSLVDAVLRRAAIDAAFRATAIHDPVAALAEVACERDQTVNAVHAERVTFIRATDDAAVRVAEKDATFVLPDVGSSGNA